MSLIDLQIERAVAGGHMLARHGGIIVLVAGAIPGERVRARIERRGKSVIFARVEEVVSASPARRPGVADPSCGGMDYAHMAYPEQLRCKREIIGDALHRIGRITIPGEVAVAGSPEQGYRLRSKLHVAGGRAGFVREGSHTLCDATATGQLLPESVPAVGRVLGRIGNRADRVATVVVAENVPARQRVLHLEGPAGSSLHGLDSGEWGQWGEWTDADISGVTAAVHGRIVGLAGAAHVTDTATDLFGQDTPVPASTTWTRQAASFFQANRFLVGSLARAVLDGVDGRRIADLYAGVGLFAVTLAARGHDVVAVEGDRISGRDLATNAAPFGERLRPIRASVEDGLRQIAKTRFDTIVLDPPRTGVSAAALDAVISFRTPCLVYVSCDPPTLARDSARLVASGYRLASLRAFDLFPNTAHVEAVAVWTRED
jgi:23S rRNA (uracil1939-C5)-methyltransferase